MVLNARCHSPRLAFLHAMIYAVRTKIMAHIINIVTAISVNAFNNMFMK
jgi:hypothetical protein